MTDAEFINASRRTVSRARIRNSAKPKSEHTDRGSASRGNKARANDHPAATAENKRSSKRPRNVATRRNQVSLRINYWSGLIEDHATRQASSAKTMAWGAFIGGSLVMAHYTIQGKLTDDMFMWYLVAFAANAAMSKFSSVRTRRREFEDEYDKGEYDVRRRW